MRGARADWACAAVFRGAVHARAEADARAHAVTAAARRSRVRPRACRHRNVHWTCRQRGAGRTVGQARTDANPWPRLLLDLQLEEQAGIEALCPNGRAQVWTHKQAGVAARGTLRIDGGPAREVQALAVIDDTIGHHTRHTEWHWSAGVGESPDGIPLAWNLVSGVNDPPQGSERAVWVAGSAVEAAPSASPPTCRASAARMVPSCASPPRPSAAATTSC